MMPPFFALLAGCDALSSGDAAASQLESVVVAQDSAAMEDFILSGALGLAGADADWTLTVSPPDATPLNVTFHAPGRPDLSPLHGLDGTVELYADWFGEHWSLAVLDEAGPRYVLDLGMHGEQVAALFGGTLVTLGEEELGSEADATWTWSFRSLVVATDDGPVEVRPGEARAITLDGATWRFVAIAAYVREPQPGASLPGCPTLDEMASYELLRVEAPPEDETLTRPEGMGPAAAGCG